MSPGFWQEVVRQSRQALLERNIDSAYKSGTLKFESSMVRPCVAYILTVSLINDKNPGCRTHLTVFQV